MEERCIEDRLIHSDDILVQVLGVRVLDDTVEGAIGRLFRALVTEGPLRVVYFVNAHTLNIAAEDESFGELLNRADVVFGDGTGVRWAARRRGVKLRANLNGTDLVPALLSRGYEAQEVMGRRPRFFMLGAGPGSIDRAAAHAESIFRTFSLVGHHNGYVDERSSQKIVADINRARADVLLVGMGNPRQEQWLDRYRDKLRVRLAFGVGGLFDYWAGNLTRAPLWARRAGIEWLHILSQQPAKLARYAVGNPKFIARMIMTTSSDRDATEKPRSGR